MEPLKICFTSNASPWTKFHGGGQIFVHRLAQALGRLGHDVVVLFAGPRDALPKERCDYRLEWASYIGYPWTPALRQMNAFTVHHKLQYLHRRFGFQVINASGEEALFVPPLCRKTGSRFLFSIEHPWLSAVKPTLTGRRPLESLLAMVRTRDLLANRHACRQAHGVVTPSLHTRLEAIHHFGIDPSRIRVIHHGVMDEMLRPPTQRDTGFLEKPLVFFGRLEPQKGVDLLLGAYHRLLEEGVIKDQPLVLIGSGPQEKVYRKTVARLGLEGRVYFKGWQPAEAVCDMLSQAGLCVLPSRAESFGLSMAEALAQGVPLVTTSAGSIPEVTDACRGAWLAEPGDQDALMHTLRQALEHYPESLRRAEHGKGYVRGRFLWEGAARAYEAFYRELLE